MNHSKCFNEQVVLWAAEAAGDWGNSPSVSQNKATRFLPDT